MLKIYITFDRSEFDLGFRGKTFEIFPIFWCEETNQWLRTEYLAKGTRWGIHKSPLSIFPICSEEMSPDDFGVITVSQNDR